MTDRVLVMQGIQNFRDYGGYRVAGGGRIRTDLLYRSGQHASAVASDLARVDELKLATVVDLRSPAEWKVAPCVRGARFSAQVLRTSDRSRAAAPHLAIGADLRSADDARRTLRASYREMPFSPSMIEGFRTYFSSIAECIGPHLVHCMAGKDRTGLAVAMLHKVMGVHDDDRMADYLLTNTAGDPEARIAEGAPAVRAVFANLSEDGVREMMGVDPTYLDAAFATIDERHGSFDWYARDVLGIDPERHRRLAERLVIA